ncbi:MAG: zinc-binding dehydrogenase [Burkholderiaceae bacterium]|nr:zinc-binding dehydrogenase [Burkholderiaceae bacterium]
MTLPTTGLQLRSLVQPDGVLRLSLEPTPVPALAAADVLVRIEATPINPSDIGLLFGAADPATFEVTGPAASPVATARIPERAMPAMAARVGQSMPVGNEGAGVVIAAGDSPAAQALLGRTVAVLGGAMYAQYRAIAAAQCLLLPEGTTPAEGASCFVNPLTALGMTETMKREGHTALVHTAAASNLGQMLNRICLKDGIGLVNIVRKPEQEALLRSQGAKHVCNMTAPDFMAQLTDALAATGATIAFDATGGGTLAGQILQGMEAAINRSAKEYSRYGSAVHKQVYLYGHLDTRPTEIHRTFGMAWGVGGWLLTPFLQKIGPEGAQALRQRVASELKTTFASHYARELSLAEALSLEAIRFYGARNTGSKVLINPARGL